MELSSRRRWRIASDQQSHKLRRGHAFLYSKGSTQPSFSLKTVSKSLKNWAFRVLLVWAGQTWAISGICWRLTRPTLWHLQGGLRMPVGAASAVVAPAGSSCLRRVRGNLGEPEGRSREQRTRPSSWCPSGARWTEDLQNKVDGLSMEAKRLRLVFR